MLRFFDDHQPNECKKNKERKKKTVTVITIFIRLTSNIYYTTHSPTYKTFGCKIHSHKSTEHNQTPSTYNIMREYYMVIMCEKLLEVK